MTFKIDKDAPLPDRLRDKYPWNDMDVGDSFLVPLIHLGRIRAAMGARNWRDKHVRHFMMRTTEEGIRVWRDK